MRTRTLATLLALLALSLAGCQSLNYIRACSTPGYDWETGTFRKALGGGIPFGQSVQDVEDAADRAVVSVTFTESKRVPNPHWKDVGKTYHYRNVTVQGPDKRVITMVYTHRDGEDGGNSFGWVEEGGRQVAWIVDCTIQHRDW
jgi:hypothetical protein